MPASTKIPANHDYPMNHELLSIARAIAIEVKDVRAELARKFRKGNTYREAQLGLAIARIQAVMAEVKRENCRIAAVRPTGKQAQAYAKEMAAASDTLQRERRKLYKMRWVPLEGLDWEGPPTLVVIEQDEFSRILAAAKKSGYRPAKEVVAVA